VEIMAFLSLKVDFYGLVLLHLGGKGGAEAHCIPCADSRHKPLLTIADKYVEGIRVSDSRVLQRLQRSASGDYEVDLTGLYSELGRDGDVRYARGLDQAAAAKNGWRDLYWPLDLAYLAGTSQWPTKELKPAALTLFRSGHLDGRQPTQKIMRKAEWVLKPARGAERTQWLSDGMVMDVSLETEEGRAEWAFKGLPAHAGDPSTSFAIVLKEGDDDTGPFAQLSNLCSSPPIGELEMEDVAEYGKYLGYEIAPPKVKEPRSRFLSPNATRCPPAYFLQS
jgi:hypothetical protein